MQHTTAQFNSTPVLGEVEKTECDQSTLQVLFNRIPERFAAKNEVHPQEPRRAHPRV